MTARRPRRDDGSASLELLALLPLLLVVALMVLQAGAAMWTMTSTAEAAREAARAYALGQSPAAAAERSLPDSLDAVRVETVGPGHGVRLTVRVPRVSPLPVFEVTRQAVLP